MTVKLGTFETNGKSFPTIELLSEKQIKGKPGFVFGLKKAQLILANIDEIQRFVESNTKGGNPNE